jgi:splicing factor 3A subunit 3
LFKLHGLGI